MPSPTPPSALIQALLETTKHLTKPTRSSSSPLKPAHHQPKPQHNRLSILHSTYQPHPRPINVATLNPTAIIASERHHPQHIKTRRRLSAFDPQILHWRVKCPLEVAASKASVRTRATRRVRVAFERVLRRRGWGRDGRRVIDDVGGGREGGLRGALLISIDGKSKGVVTASGEEVERSCEGVLEMVVRRMRGGAGGSGGGRVARGR